MRAVVFLLVLGNLLFFAWSQGYFGVAASPDAGRSAQQVAPERIRIVARGEPPPIVVVAPTAPVQACLLWGGLIAADADRLARLVGEKTPAATVTRRNEATTARAWWVYAPPASNRSEAERKVAELRKVEVGEMFVVQDGPNRHAISLGVFASEAAAQSHLESLRRKGARGLRAGPRGNVEQHVGVVVRGVATDLATLRELFVDHPARECPANGGGNGGSS